MTPEQWQRVKRILDGALPLSVEARASYVADACGEDGSLRREVESLLASHEQAKPEFLQMPVARLAGAPSSGAAAATRSGGRVGAYDVLAPLGRGGMGEVYRAIRADGHFTKAVAIKIVRTGFDSAFVLERFRHERQILANLDHPNIARLLDGGTTDDGIPYLVMELVEGVAIDAYCDGRGLGVVDRLRLFQQVCGAVQYAHQRLVVHRDIKPSNILVTDDGTPKLLDFGIAKIVDETAAADLTMARPMTVEYASPEQLRGETITTATDVYALGVVLYRLLTGRSPYGLENPTSGELSDAITGREPDRPSAAAPALRRQLRGDLDAIASKALRKEPAKRYSSPEQLAEDIERHLSALPVAARRGTWTYAAGRFARRHRAAVAAGALVVSTLVAGLVLTAREARIAEANRRRADARFNDVRKLANSLIFEVHDSIRDLPGAVDARRLVLQRAVEYLDSLASEGSRNPDLQRELATAYRRIGGLQGNEMQMNLGDPAAAVASLRKSLALLEPLVRADPSNSRDEMELARAYLDYAEMQASGVGNVAEGFAYAKRSLAIIDRHAAATPGDPRIITEQVANLSSLGMLQVGEGLIARVGSFAGAKADLERGRDLAARLAAAEPASQEHRYQQSVFCIVLGDLYLKMGDRAQSIAQYNEGLALLKPLVDGGANVRAIGNFVVTQGKIGDVLLIEGDLSQALAYYADAERAATGLAARDPDNERLQVLGSVAVLEVGRVLSEQGHADEGLRYMRDALARIRADRNHTSVARSTEVLIRSWYGGGLERAGRLRDASAQYEAAKAVLEPLLAGGKATPRVQEYYATATLRHAAALEKLGERGKSTGEYEQAQRVLEPLVAADPEDQELAYALAETYTARGAVAAADAARQRSADAARRDWESARGWLQKSLAVWSRIPHPARMSTSGFEVTLPSDVAKRLQRCEAALRAPRITASR